MDKANNRFVVIVVHTREYFENDEQCLLGIIEGKKRVRMYISNWRGLVGWNSCN